MKNQLLILLLFISVMGFAQRKQLITGYVTSKNTPIDNVHVINKKTNKGTITNEFGRFEIYANPSDILKFSHVNFETLEVIIDNKIISDNQLDIELSNKTYALEEIVLSKPKSIFHVDKDILPPPKVNAQTLNLPNANKKVKKDETITKFSFTGASIDLDNLINVLNGNARRKRLLNKLKYEDSILAKIRKDFTDDFFITDLSIKKENINAFLNYCLNKNIIKKFNKKEKLQLTTILIRESRTFPNKLKNELTLLKKTDSF